MADYKPKLVRGIKRIGRSHYHGVAKDIARLVFAHLPSILDESGGVLATSQLNRKLREIDPTLDADTIAVSLRRLVELAGSEKGVYVTTLQAAAERVFRSEARGCEFEIHGFVPSRYDKARNPDVLALKTNSPVYYRGEESLTSFIKRYATHTTRRIFRVNFRLDDRVEE